MLLQPNVYLTISTSFYCYSDNLMVCSCYSEDDAFIASKSPMLKVTVVPTIFVVGYRICYKLLTSGSSAHSLIILHKVDQQTQNVTV